MQRLRGGRQTDGLADAADCPDAARMGARMQRLRLRADRLSSRTATNARQSVKRNPEMDSERCGTYSHVLSAAGWVGKTQASVGGHRRSDTLRDAHAGSVPESRLGLVRGKVWEGPPADARCVLYVVEDVCVMRINCAILPR